MHLQPQATSFLLLSLHALTYAPATALAASSSTPERRVSAPFQLPSRLDHHNAFEDQRRPWTRLRDGLIQRIFRLPTTDAARSLHNVANPAKGRNDQRPGPPFGLVARYSGDVVLRFNISSVDEAKSLAEATNVLFLDVWESRDDWVDIRLSKDVVPSLLGLLPKSLQHAHTPLMHDLAQTIYESYPSSLIHPTSPAPPTQQRDGFSPALRSSPAPSPTSDNVFFRDYQPLSVIIPWMRLMASLFPTHVRMFNVGISYEGRDIPALRLGVHPANSQQSPSPPPRKTIIISGGSHAREWISVSTVTYIAYSLITSYGKSASTTSLLEKFDFIFIPTLNPDGYVYTWETDRLWRKNRQQTSLRFCRGLDLDRGWGFQWGAASPSEAQNQNPCSESYPGSTPFEAHESRRFADWARNATASRSLAIVGFLDLHSYSQQILYPYSYSCSSYPPSLENLEELAIGLAKSIRLSQRGRGETYRVTSACEASVTSERTRGGGRLIHPRMEPGGGSALDWFYHEMGVRYSYQIKLRDTGGYGFLLPRENIVPTGEEAVAAVRYFGEFLAKSGALADEDGDSASKDKNDEEQRSVEREMGSDGKGELLDDDVGPEDMGWELRRRRR